MTSSEPSLELIGEALERMILSASGWRAVFAHDGDEESRSAKVTDEFLVLSALAATVFAEHIGKGSRVVVGSDTRPTGPAIAQAILAALTSHQVEVEYTGVAASPEIMAYAARRDTINGFFYISASHNPIGHNGFKMGGADGGVLAGRTIGPMIERFREFAADGEAVKAAIATLTRPPSEKVAAALRSQETTKEAATSEYETHANEIARGPGSKADKRFTEFRDAVVEARPGIAIDFNGSARAASLDVCYLESLGCGVSSIGAVPGKIDHVIVPEGEGLAACTELLTASYARDPSYLFGYTPDNDGDRGNIVVALPRGARALEAQEVFALAVVAELSWLESCGVDLSEPTAVVVNGPTSLRTDRIASAFGVRLERTEVGEANVVNRARELRDEGVRVRILGEGSNGGNITHPGAVRDPLQTVLSFLKLLVTPGDRVAPLMIWSRRIGTGFDQSQTRLEWLLESLPAFCTTSTSSTDAKVRLHTRDHAALKSRVEANIKSSLPGVISALSREFGTIHWEIANYEGTRVRPGRGNRTGNERGGWKLRFIDALGVERAFAWMRGSGTEPVFRVLVDVEGDRAGLHDEILQWLREEVGKADATGS